MNSLPREEFREWGEESQNVGKVIHVFNKNDGNGEEKHVATPVGPSWGIILHYVLNNITNGKATDQPSKLKFPASY